MNAGNPGHWGGSTTNLGVRQKDDALKILGDTKRSNFTVRIKPLPVLPQFLVKNWLNEDCLIEVVGTSSDNQTTRLCLKGQPKVVSPPTKRKCQHPYISSRDYFWVVVRTWTMPRSKRNKVGSYPIQISTHQSSCPHQDKEEGKDWQDRAGRRSPTMRH